MTIAFFCSHCGKPYEKEASLAGRKARCRDCGNIFTIPRGSSAPAPAPNTAVSRPASRARPGSSEPVRGRSRPSANDLFDLDELPPPGPQNTAPDDGEELPTRTTFHRTSPKPRERKRRPRRPDDMRLSLHDFIVGVLFPLGFVTILGLIVFFVASPGGRFATLVVIMFVGVIVTWVGSIAGIVVAFRESSECGVCYMVVPLYALYYTMTRWDTMRGPFGIFLLGFALAIVPPIYLPIYAPARLKAHEADQAVETDGLGRPWHAPHHAIGPDDSPHEAYLKELLNAFDDATEAWNRVGSGFELSVVAPRLREVENRLRALRARRVVSTREEADRLKAYYEIPLRGSIGSLISARRSAYGRLRRPVPEGAPFPLLADGTPDTDRCFYFNADINSTTDDPMLFGNWGVVPAAAPGPIAPAEPAPAAERPREVSSRVMVVVRGFPDDDAHQAGREAIENQLAAIVEALSLGRAGSISSEFRDGRLVYSVMPVDDPQALADRITFGKVTRVLGREIEVEYQAEE